MTTYWIEKALKYDGSQLSPLFAYLNFGILGDSIVGWRGPCDVSLANMLDGEDKIAQAKICGSDMLHFVIEKFDCDLLGAVALQRLLAAMVLEALKLRVPHEAKSLRRDGDDIYWGDKKFSISIATVSAVSAMIHFAVNVSNLGTPVPTCCLEDFNVAPESFAKQILSDLQSEVLGVVRATRKVLPAK